MRILLFIIALFFIGCSQKSVDIYAVVKPNQVTSDDIRNIKIEDIKNDKVNLKEKIIQKMQAVNNIIPGYFSINDKNFKSVLKAKEDLVINDEFYLKKVKINYENNRCKVALYPCKNINNMIFCKKTPKIYSLKDFDNLQKEGYENKNYILINNDIYKKEINCKPEFVNIKCERKTILLDVKIDIVNRDNIFIFSNDYQKSLIDDSCEDIDEIGVDDARVYNSDVDLETEKNHLANLIANDFIKDIAPHYATFSASLFDDVDVDMNSKDEDKFKKIIDSISDNVTTTFKFIPNMQNLLSKYPKSCVIRYDLAVMYMQVQEFKKAKKLLSNLKCKNRDILNERDILLNYLNELY